MKASGTQTPFFGTMSDACYKATHFYQRLNLYVMMKFKLFLIVLSCSLSPIGLFSADVWYDGAVARTLCGDAARQDFHGRRQLPEQGTHTAHLVLSYLQLLSECHHLPLSGSGLHMYAFQGGGVGPETIRVQRIHEPGPLLFSPFACVEGGTVLEIHAGCRAGDVRPVHFLRRGTSRHHGR